ncbi:unnamed protein product [Effrenium voratum]|nr:unnamed protein product [Effrenium voratum]
MSSEIHIDLLHDAGPSGMAAGAAGLGAAVIAIELDDCRQLFMAEGGRWSTTGCTGTQPPWARADQPAIRLGPSGAAFPGQVRSLRFVLDRERQEVIMYCDNVTMLPSGAAPGQLGVPVGGGVGSPDVFLCHRYHGGKPRSFKACKPEHVHCRVVELVVWPEATLEALLGWLPAARCMSGHQANILWQQAILTERKAAEDSWGFLRGGGPGHSASAGHCTWPVASIRSDPAMLNPGAAGWYEPAGLTNKVPRERFRKPATTQQDSP